jgi:anti-sigma regulatory factor (Ser/Thr protein kinase)
MTETTLRAAPNTEAVDRARRLAVRTMYDWRLWEQEEPVTAIAVEFVANAVRHARTPLELRLLRGPGQVRVEVRDHSPQMPRLGTPGPSDEGGRGLFLVRHFATRWGADPVPGGKIVWAEVSL